ncbi:MAG: hypothetical protein ACI845_002235 [Gammaproteobacteria bacterium]|jgi:hypothetical protein
MNPFISDFLISKLKTYLSKLVKKSLPRVNSAPNGDEKKASQYKNNSPCEFGGYNEAFIVHYWTGFNPHH